MENLNLLLQSVTIFFLLIVFIQILKRQGIFSNSHQPVFNRLVTELVLPATIFSTLAVSTIEQDQILSAAIMLGAIIICCGTAYVMCRALRFSYRKTGSIVMLAGFGSTSTLAYPLISQTYGVDSEGMTFGIVVGEFGVCIPFFTLGVLIAAYFGSRESMVRPDVLPVIVNFLKSPIFIAFLLGLIVSQIPPASAFMSTVFAENFFGYFTHGLELLVAITVGLMLRPIQIRSLLSVLGIVVALKMILQPLLVLGGASAAGLAALPVEILVIEASMPSGAVAAVIADRYGCDGPLASTMVIATYLVSLVTIPLISYLVI
jgi:predicted permease